MELSKNLTRDRFENNFVGLNNRTR